MTWTKLASRLAKAGEVPAVLAGPVLRHVDRAQATVFLALRAKRTVTLRVHAGIDGSGKAILSGSREAVQVGTNLSLVAVTARPIGTDVLLPETTYCYDIDLGDGLSLASDGALAARASDARLGYGTATLPTFALPPASLDQVRLVHASCRKPHGQSLDALPGLDTVLTALAADIVDIGSTDAARRRPHQLFLTGDQIYADDVADCLLFMLLDAANALLGWDEPLPGTSDDALRPGGRARLTLDAGLTSGVPDPSYPKSHLLRFGEFAAMYLFAWSPVLWPADVPTYAEVGTAIAPTKPLVFDRERELIAGFQRTVTGVRKALANVPTYMVLDDHEVTDDWLMNRRWCSAPVSRKKPPGGALTTPLGLRVMQNALVAYALFQAWGNTPEQFAENGPEGAAGRALLTAASAWRGATDIAYQGLGTAVGMPAALTAGDITLTRPPGALRWHYRVAPQGAAYEVLMLDCRTAREYPPRDEASDLAGAGLLTATAVQAQVTDQQDDGRKVTIVVSQTPVLGIPGIEWLQETATDDDVWARDVEAWSLHQASYQRLLAALAHRRDRVVVLAGDVHYSFAARMSYWASRPFGFPALPTKRSVTIAQLNSSALKNEGDKWKGSMRLHLGGYDSVLFKLVFRRDLAKEVNRVGWAQPQTTSITLDGKVMAPLGRPPGWDRSPAVLDPGELPDGHHLANAPEWGYQVKYLPGRKPTPGQAVLPVLAVRPVSPTQLQSLQLAYLQHLGDKAGRDIVGRNNISMLRFVTDTTTGAPTSVEQVTWWRPSDAASLVPTTTFTVTLTPNPPP